MAIFSDPTRLLVPTLKITAYTDKEQKEKVGSISLPYDKSSLDVGFKNCVSGRKTVDGANDNTFFNGAKPSTLKVTFLLDDTTFSNPIAYLMPNNFIPGSVDKEIKKLKGLCHSIDDKNKVNYLAISSSGMPLLDSASGVFHGLLTDMKVKNEIVDMLGNRVKAQVTCSFKHADINEEGKSAGMPDATMMVAALGALSLAAVAASNYGSIASLAKLAVVNGLDTVRKIKSGKVIKVPPVKEIKEKAEEVHKQADIALEKTSSVVKDNAEAVTGINAAVNTGVNG